MKGKKQERRGKRNRKVMNWTKRTKLTKRGQRKKDDAGNEVDVGAKEDKGDEVGERYIGNKAEEWDKVDEGE